MARLGPQPEISMKLKSKSDPYCQGRPNRRRDEHPLTAPPLNPQDTVTEQPECWIGA
jgi:hypothetical protein